MKKFLTACLFAGIMSLTACSMVDLSQPKTQLSHTLSGTGAGLVQQNGNLRVIMPTTTGFHPNSSRLTPAMINVLAQVTNTLRAYPNLKVKVIGYTDNRGNPRTNKLVSLRRALVVADYFRNHGINSYRISVAGMGDANPYADNNTAQGRLLNRRVELVLNGG